MPHLTYRIDGPIATITLNNPPQNRLTIELTASLEDAVAAISESAARVLVIEAEGPDFSWGGDITFWPGAETGYLRSFFERFLTVVNRLERLPIPTIAAVQGFCLGGGFEIALRCDIIIAERSAQFGHPEQTLAVTTLLGGVYRVAERAGRAFAADMAFTSAKVPAEEMQRRGVVNQVVDDGGLRDAFAAYATKMATGPTKAHAAHKALLRIWALGGVQAADEALMDISIPLFDSDDTQRALHSAVDSLAKGVPRPTLDFHNR